MITIYSKNIPLFIENFKNLGYGVLKDFTEEPKITEVLNAEYNLEFKYIKNGFNSEYLIEQNIIKANGQLFRIWYIKKELNSIYILAKHIIFDLQKNFVEDTYPQNKTGHEALEWVLNNTQYPNNFSVSGNTVKIESARYVRKNPIEIIYGSDNSILKRFGGELEIDNFHIKLLEKRGSSNKLFLRQGKNIVGATYNLDLSTVATRIIPQGKDGLFLPEKYIDSSFINNYFNPFIYKLDLTDIGVDEETSQEETFQKMRETVLEMYKNGIDKPKISVEIDFIELSKTEEYKNYSNLETAHLGDTVNCYIPTFNLNIETRIVKTIYNCSKNRIEKLELGSIQPNFVRTTVENKAEINNFMNEANPVNILSKAKEEASKLLKHPFKGYISINENTGEMYLMDNPDINEAVKVWKFGLGGIGYSKTGINGTYETAITSNGEIVADFIKTGQLNTSVIAGYSQLQNQVTQLKFNVDSIESQVVNNINLTKEITEKGTYIANKALARDSLEFKLYGSEEKYNNIYPGEVTYPFNQLKLGGLKNDLYN